MELDNKSFSKIVELIEESKKNKNYELEVRFWSKKLLINEEKFNKIFQKLIFSKKNNGLGFNYEMINLLDIILDKKSINNNYSSIRMTIDDKENIKKYWLNNNIDELNPKFIEKEKIDKLDEKNYDLRFSLNNEIPENELFQKNIDLLKNNDFEKVFRLKNRYSIKTEDKLFNIDMSSIKINNGFTFKDSNVIKSNSLYEIEIEFINKETELSSEEIAKKLLKYCELILKIIQNSNFLISNNLSNILKKNYFDLVKSNLFVAASPVTIHKINLIKNNDVANIYNNYAVTLKADGERYFLFVNKSDNVDKNGKIYLFNNNYNFIDTGLINTEFTNTLIEGEFIEKDNIFYMYDILFFKNTDVRKKQFINEKSSDTRISNLIKFKQSKKKAIIDENFCVKIELKQYLQTIKENGSDIFEVANKLWDEGKTGNFYVDGIIFVPKFEYYPIFSSSPSWTSLFKWKPPELNTIDFLVKVVKNDINEDIKSPFFEEIDRLDGKKETNLKQYKILKLYVTGYKSFFNKNNKNNVRVKQKKIPILFNPYDLDPKNSEEYNEAKIILDENDKMFAFNCITNEKEEIYDNTIVEFSYDLNKKEGFKWIPHKVRNDKTELYLKGEPIFGNSVKTANDVFKAIMNPVTEDMITGKSEVNVASDTNFKKSQIEGKPYYIRENINDGKRKRFAYQNFHNRYIKYQLLYFASPSYILDLTGDGKQYGKLLDLCCGNGGDLNKIRDAKYAELVGMDIDYENIRQAQERYKIFPKPKPKTFYVRGDSSKLIFPNQSSGLTNINKTYTRKYIPTKYIFDTISLQFCFHYFFESEIKLRSVLQNINDNLKINGLVIGTTFDGEKIYNELKKNNTAIGKTEENDIIWKIDKKYGERKIIFDDKKPNYGKKIDVFVKTIGNIHSEFLVNFNYLDNIMEEYGFSKIFVKPFEDFYNELLEGNNLMDLSDPDLEQHIKNIKNMSDAEKKFSFFSSAFMYKKIKNSSDSSYKKLIDLMEKEAKSKKKVYVVNKNTEEIIQNYEKNN